MVTNCQCLSDLVEYVSLVFSYVHFIAVLIYCFEFDDFMNISLCVQEKAMKVLLFGVLWVEGYLFSTLSKTKEMSYQ